MIYILMSIAFIVFFILSIKPFWKAISSASEPDNFEKEEVIENEFKFLAEGDEVDRIFADHNPNDDY